MKKITFIAAALILTLSLNTVAGAASVYGTSSTQQPAPAATETKNTAAGLPQIEHIPLGDNSIPLVKTTVRANANAVPNVVLSGSKTSKVGIKTVDVSLTAVSDNKDILVRCWGGSLELTNRGLTAGSSATVTVTAKKQGYETLVQKIKVSVSDGSQQYPHKITTAEDLQAIKTLGLDNNYEQTMTIDLSDIKDWSAIGDRVYPFTGTYDGNNNAIKGMSFSNIDAESDAIFGFVRGADARIEEVKLEGRIEPLYYTSAAHGTIVGILDGGSVMDSSFKGDVFLDKEKTVFGGIASTVINNGKIKNCSFSGNIVSKSYGTVAGGIVGELMGSVENAVVTGAFSAEGQGGVNGGVAGKNYGSIASSNVTMNISRYGEDSKVGGIAGENHYKIEDSVYEGKLYARGNNAISGGIAGQNKGSIDHCTVTGELEASGRNIDCGGIAGLNQGKISMSVSAAAIKGSGELGNAGGIAGRNYSEYSYLTINAKSSSISVIDKSAFTGTVNFDGRDSAAGGIAGKNYGLTEVQTAVENSAASIITNCISLASQITGAKAGRITAVNLRTGGGVYKENTHPVYLKDNYALDTAGLNGAAASLSLGADSLNGKSITAKEGAELLEKIKIDVER